MKKLMKFAWDYLPVILILAVSGLFLAASGFNTSNVYLTPIGGQAVLLTNRSAQTTYYGMLVTNSSAYSSAFSLETDTYDTIGACYQSGITNGGLCWVVVGGVADVAMCDNFVATLGAVAFACAASPGRADGQPNPGGGLPGADRHFAEVGHYIGTNTAGTNQVARAVLHFN